MAFNLRLASETSKSPPVLFFLNAEYRLQRTRSIALRFPHGPEKLIPKFMSAVGHSLSCCTCPLRRKRGQNPAISCEPLAPHRRMSVEPLAERVAGFGGLFRTTKQRHCRGPAPPPARPRGRMQSRSPPRAALQRCCERPAMQIAGLSLAKARIRSRPWRDP
jgi:hypothetical protein